MACLDTAFNKAASDTPSSILGGCGLQHQLHGGGGDPPAAQAAQLTNRGMVTLAGRCRKAEAPMATAALALQRPRPAWHPAPQCSVLTPHQPYWEQHSVAGQRATPAPQMPPEGLVGIVHLGHQAGAGVTARAALARPCP